jgi:hypothetical protein
MVAKPTKKPESRDSPAARLVRATFSIRGPPTQVCEALETLRKLGLVCGPEKILELAS